MRDPMGAFRPRERKCEAKSVRRWRIYFPPRRSHAICFTRAQGVSMYKMGLGRGKGWKGGGKGQMHVAFTPIAAPRAAHKRVGASPRTPCFST